MGNEYVSAITEVLRLRTLLRLQPGSLLRLQPASRAASSCVCTAVISGSRVLLKLSLFRPSTRRTVAIRRRAIQSSSSICPLQ